LFGAEYDMEYRGDVAVGHVQAYCGIPQSPMTHVTWQCAAPEGAPEKLGGTYPSASALGYNAGYGDTRATCLHRPAHMLI
jgi:hypothetical protein